GLVALGSPVSRLLAPLLPLLLVLPSAPGPVGLLRPVSTLVAVAVATVLAVPVLPTITASIGLGRLGPACPVRRGLVGLILPAGAALLRLSTLLTIVVRARTVRCCGQVQLELGPGGRLRCRPLLGLAAGSLVPLTRAQGVDQFALAHPPGTLDAKFGGDLL